MFVPPVLSHRLEFYILLMGYSRIVFKQMQLNSVDVPGLFNHKPTVSHSSCYWYLIFLNSTVLNVDM